MFVFGLRQNSVELLIESNHATVVLSENESSGMTSSFVVHLTQYRNTTF